VPCVLFSSRSLPIFFHLLFSKMLRVARLRGKAIFKPCYRSLCNSARLDWRNCNHSARNRKKQILRFQPKYDQCRGNNSDKIQLFLSEERRYCDRRDSLVYRSNIAHHESQLRVLEFLGNRQYIRKIYNSSSTRGKSFKVSISIITSE